MNAKSERYNYTNAKCTYSSQSPESRFRICIIYLFNHKDSKDNSIGSAETMKL